MKLYIFSFVFVVAVVVKHIVTHWFQVFMFICMLHQMLMEIHDADIAVSSNSCFSYATKCDWYVYHIAFLANCKTFDVLHRRLRITNVPYICFMTDDIKSSCLNTTKPTKTICLKRQFWG